MRDESPRLSDKALSELEDEIKNIEEAFTLLSLIDAEFRSYPTSVQCFDLRIVDRVRLCVEARKQLLKKQPWLVA